MAKKKAVNIVDVKARVKDIKDWDARNDYEAAHSAEDRLYVDVLHAIAKECDDVGASDLAKEALKTQKLKFPRFTA